MVTATSQKVRIGALLALLVGLLVFVPSRSVDGFDVFVAAISSVGVWVWALCAGAWALFAAPFEPGAMRQVWREVAIWGGLVLALALTASPYILIVDDMTGQGRDPFGVMLIGGLVALVVGILGWAVPRVFTRPQTPAAIDGGAPGVERAR